MVIKILKIQQRISMSILVKEKTMSIVSFFFLLSYEKYQRVFLHSLIH
jgi:hypothetical protein